ncbi:MAG TPA: hypothetical protein VLW65_17530 [Bryobacteraceae bacterium]|nr:hypothetical protein [Bryobacteraceae bacterium]
MALQLAEWVDRIFGEADPANYERFRRFDGICGPNEVTLLRLIEVFERPSVTLSRYSDQFLDQAVWDLSTQAFHAVYDPAIDWIVSARFIRSFKTLFRELYAARCRPVLGHCGEKGSPLNMSCYMWWDFDCWSPAPDPLSHNPHDSVLLESMRSILSIPHIACKESALHGLGHWHQAQSATVDAILDSFLASEHDLPEGLREYALNARRGYVE